MTRSVVYGPIVTLDAGGNVWTNLADGVAASDAATVGQIGSGGSTWSVLTDGVVATPALIFAAGDVIMVES